MTDQNEEFDPDRDLTLLGLVELVNGAEPTEIGITLQVSGQTVTGKLVGVARYFKLVAESCPDTPLAEYFQRVGEFHEGDEVDADAEFSWAARFAHLRDATIFSGGTRLNVNLWRGRLSQVSAWSLGTLNGTDPVGE